MEIEELKQVATKLDGRAVDSSDLISFAVELCIRLEAMTDAINEVVKAIQTMDVRSAWGTGR